MDSQFVVTVGLCVKNGATIIKKAVDSLCRQTFPAQNTEIIVVDGNSKDGTLQIIKANLKTCFGRIQIFQENHGLGVARQMVIQKASGKYIVWLDADMMLAPNYLENQVSFMEQNPDVGIAGGTYTLHIGHGLAADLENVAYAVDSIFGRPGSASKFGFLPGAEGAIYRVEAVRQVGGFDTQINGAAEDTDLAYRVRAKGWQLAMTQERFTESTRASWQTLWNQYVWYGRGGHYIFHKDSRSVNLLQMSPMAGFVAGILRSPGAYLLTHNTTFFLLPVHYTYKRIAWFCGFCNAHLSGYGHKID
ncbi:MAG: glycosyltransferase [Nitrososphaerota archaeon]|uniref:glycosyltransferase n=1 Tax=Candidatus Bathycorpusculum sp. TaxID=2994959 RepID=UPI00281C8B7B|nr:glycosyltransferase [Candidatus Termitimicrobium sp.]MCL2431313.1 glycosyltransferase [Candidatus Termitimicrobium sp.]MDR0493820.1 glycosyltransferase [Nitrososphaerota archaeon]